MNIHRPNLFGGADRIQPIDGDRNDDPGQEEKRRKRVQYRGREWSEGDDDPLPVPPSLPGGAVEESQETYSSHGVYGNRALIEKAERHFDRLVTLEEKIAQLLFCAMDADYDPHVHASMEILIQRCLVGGVLFTGGEYKRQAYLIERYRELAKTPLLFGNDFLHGLSFYFQGELPLASFGERMTTQRYSDLGKAVMVQNRRLGVHLQFERERARGAKIIMNEEQVRAFRKGIREAQGLVGREKVIQRKREVAKGLPSIFSTSLEKKDVQETIGMRTLHFLDLTRATTIDEKLLDAFHKPYEVFLVPARALSQVIELIANAIRKGKIKEADLDRKVMKVLLIKALFSSI